MIDDVKNSRYGEVVARVNSRSQPDKVYEVRDRGDSLSCNCKGWIFNRETPRRCRHTDAVVACDGNSYPNYSVQAQRRKASRDIRAGAKQKRDVVSKIVISILRAGGYNKPLPGALLRMAAVLRPHLLQKDLQVVPDPAVVAARASDLINQTTRCITLDD